jgi:sugar lactone lactonase YvrE
MRNLSASVRTLSLAAVGLAASLPATLLPLRVGASDDAPHTADVSILVRGAALHGASGLSFGPSSRLFVASTLGREIVVMDKGSGQIMDRYTHADGVETPEDLVFGPGGELLFTSIGTGEVGRLGAQGRFETAFSLPLGANSIAFSPRGRLFVGLCTLGAGLFELDTQAGAPPRSIREFPGESCGIDAFDIGADGLLYGPRRFASEVVAIDPATGNLRSVAEGFVAPAAAKFGPDGDLYVADTGAGELWRVDVALGGKRRVASIPVNTGNFTFDEAGRIFISGLDDGSVHELLADGSLRVVSPGGLSFIGGLAVLENQLFVANLYSLVGLDTVSGTRRSEEKSVAGVTELSSVMTVSAWEDRLVLSSWQNNTVQVYDPRSAQVVESYADFNIPMNAVAFGGGLAVAELGSRSVVLERAGERTLLAGGLLVPAGLAAAGSALFVSDFAAGTITRIEAGQAVVVASGLAAPEGLALTADGHVLVVESAAGRVSELDPASGQLRTFAERLALGLPSVAGYPPTFAFNGISVGPDGRVYVAGDVASDVYVLSERHRPAGP